MMDMTKFNQGIQHRNRLPIIGLLAVLGAAGILIGQACHIVDLRRELRWAQTENARMVLASADERKLRALTFGPDQAQTIHLNGEMEIRFIRKGAAR